MTYGTSYFVSMLAAIRYYEKQEGGRKGVKAIVQRKLGDREIHIGNPPTKEGEKAYVNHEEGRWFITDNKP